MKDIKYCKVRDHCHYTGEYRGAAYSMRSLKDTEKLPENVPKKIPIVSQDESNYAIILLSQSWQKYLKNNLLV